MIKILSLFDGISCAQVAINNIGIKDYIYYASEIDKYAIQITQKNYPNTIQLGDVSYIKGNDFSDIDLMIGGSPCQDLSIAGKRTGLYGTKSILFWEFVRLLEEVKPKYFVLENVFSMGQKNKQIISDVLGVQPIMIDAALVSAQKRKRYFWTNIPNIQLPENQNIFIKDILVNSEEVADRFIFHRTDITITKDLDAIPEDKTKPIRVGQIATGMQGYRIYGCNGKSVTLMSNGGGGGAKTGIYAIYNHHNSSFGTDKSTTLGTTSQNRTSIMGQQVIVRRLIPKECERLQCLPDNYTEGISELQRYKTIGNGFCVKVIEHILRYIMNEQGLFEQNHSG
jgi:DNA (cytosine-5)-methyltransferase 3A